MLHRRLYLQVRVGELLNIQPESKNLELMEESRLGARFQRCLGGQDFDQ